jgi:hypothetical protein
MKKLTPILVMASSQALAYQVIEIKPGDTLSDVLYKHNIKPLWGKANHVEKYLKINRLNGETTKSLKPGDLIIIPGESETIKTEKQYITQNTETVIYDEVKSTSSAISQTGLLAGLISRHQTIKMNFDYFHRVYHFKEANVKVNENFGAGISVRSENKYPVSELTFDPEIFAQIVTQNAARFSDDSNLAANFQPNWLMGFKGHFHNDNLPFAFYGMASIEEVSSVDQNIEKDYIVRRDQFSSIGAGVAKNLTLNNTSIDINADISTSINSQNFSDQEEMNIFKSSLFVNIQLTSDYYIGASLDSFQYTNAEVENTSTYGTKLTYKF